VTVPSLRTYTVMVSRRALMTHTFERAFIEVQRQLLLDVFTG
jgi:hypothetical protein